MVPLEKKDTISAYLALGGLQFETMIEDVER